MPSHEPNIQKEVNTLILFRVRDFPSRKMKCTTLAKGAASCARSYVAAKHFTSILSGLPSFLLSTGQTYKAFWSTEERTAP